ncbi:FAD-binding oxidoreductase [Catalinimonas sp. 4WD22]|uniref:FAD-binding oxidoreductase n=1 Tax=Catalinimonas locisalis TaxID=3133978 RepID=UPI0031010DF4
MATKLTLHELINVHGSVVNHDSLALFTSTFKGDVVTPTHADYDKVRSIWNANIDKYPGVIARCKGVADVVAAVNFAREHELLIAIRGGGHNVGGRALCDGGMVIDMSLMKGIHVDSKNRTARVQSGALLGDVDRETHVFGLAAPLGIASETGVAGLTLGGGVGWLVRKYGMTCDNVLSFDIVTADGKILLASADENEDLFWALRGGGGNFGVVTSFEYRLHPVSTVLGGLILYPREQAAEVLKLYHNFTKSASDELTAYAALLNTPDGMPVVGIIACYCGDLTEGEQVMKPLREFKTPLVDTIQPIPFPQMQTLLDAAAPDGNQYYWKSSFVKEFNDEVIKVVVDYANQATSPLSAIIVEYYGGAASRVKPSETAFAQRQEQYNIITMAQWTDPAETEHHTSWARNMADAIHDFSSDAYLLNALGEESHDIIRAAFGPNYEKLSAIKKKYDPKNFFRINQNIKPVE